MKLVELVNTIFDADQDAMGAFEDDAASHAGQDSNAVADGQTGSWGSD